MYAYATARSAGREARSSTGFRRVIFGSCRRLANYRWTSGARRSRRTSSARAAAFFHSGVRGQPRMYGVSMSVAWRASTWRRSLSSRSTEVVSTSGDTLGHAMTPRSLAMPLLALLASCGLFTDMATRRVTPPTEILVSLGDPEQYRLVLAHQAEGRGGNIHDPMSVARYQYHGCDMIFVNSIAGRVEGQHIRHSEASGPFRGFISFEGASATVRIEMFQYGGPQDGQFKPYRYNGTYPTRVVSKDTADTVCRNP